MNTASRTLVAAALLALGLQASQAAVLLTEGFDADLGGWTGNTAGTVVTHVAAGGNPDGYLESTPGTAFPGIFGAQNVGPDYSGDYTAPGINTVSVDLNFFSGDYTSALLRFRSSAADNGWAISLTNQFLNTWQSFTVVFDPTWSNAQAQANGWVQSLPEVDFDQLWTSVFNAEIRLNGVAGSGLVAGIDNFSLGITAVPEPASTTLLMAGLAALVGMRRRQGTPRTG